MLNATDLFPDFDPEATSLEDDPRSAFENVKRDDVVQIGSFRLKVLGNHGVQIYGTKAGTKGCKLYQATMNLDGTAFVEQINGMNETISGTLSKGVPRICKP